MWGTLTNLASAAAEQVQAEAANIAADMSEVTKQGFDLLDKLDRTLDDPEGESKGDEAKDSSGSEGVDEELDRTLDDPEAERKSGEAKDGSTPSSEGADEHFTMAELIKDADNEKIDSEFVVIRNTLRLPETASFDDVVRTTSTLVREKRALSAKCKKEVTAAREAEKEYKAELTALEQQHWNDKENEEKLRSEVNALKEVTLASEMKIKELLTLQQQWNHEKVALKQQLEVATAQGDELRMALDAAMETENKSNSEKKELWDSEKAALEEQLGDVKAQLVVANQEKADTESRLKAELSSALDAANVSSMRCSDLENMLQSAQDAVNSKSELSDEKKELWDSEKAALEEQLRDVKAQLVVANQEKADTESRLKAELSSALDAANVSSVSSKSELSDALLRLDKLTEQNIALNKQVEDQTLQLVAAEGEKGSLRDMKKALKESNKKVETLTFELKAARQEAVNAEANVTSKSADLDRLQHELQSCKAKLVVMKEHEKNILKKQAEEHSESKSAKEIHSLKGRIEEMVAEKQERESTLRRQLDEALAQIHELSISTHHHQDVDVPEHLVGSQVAGGVAPSTPMSQTTMAGDDSFFSPDEGSFKTPGVGPKTASSVKSKNRSKTKSKAEMAKEIQGLNQQLQELRSIQVR